MSPMLFMTVQMPSMLSAETAVGSYPLEAIRFLVRCATIAESSLDYDAILAAGVRHKRQTVTDAISYACCAIAADLGAAAIISSTSSGSTARMVARHRPKAPNFCGQPQHRKPQKTATYQGGYHHLLGLRRDHGRTD